MAKYNKEERTNWKKENPFYLTRERRNYLLNSGHQASMGNAWDVFETLLTYVNSKTGKCHPKIETLMKDMGQGKDHIQGAITKLIDLGYLTRTLNYLNTKGNGNRVTPRRQYEYTFTGLGLLEEKLATSEAKTVKAEPVKKAIRDHNLVTITTSCPAELLQDVRAYYVKYNRPVVVSDEPMTLTEGQLGASERLLKEILEDKEWFFDPSNRLNVYTFVDAGWVVDNKYPL